MLKVLETFIRYTDSDDWLDGSSYKKLLQRIKSFCESQDPRKLVDIPDLFVCNYTYNHLDEGTHRDVDYRNVFPTEEMCSWNDIGRFHASQYLIMHALVYRTEILRKSGVRLPEHTFYVDNIFAYHPLPLVKNIFYPSADDSVQ